MTVLNISLSAWNGVNALDEAVENYRTDSDDNDSLFYLFNTIPSPDPEDLNVTCAASQDAINCISRSDDLSDIKTKLYPYQKRTAATMIRREVQPRRSLDPRIMPTKGPLGHPFYYDCQTGQIFLNKKEYDEVRGGILAESMGLGKTLICLTTILATKGHWPSIPPQYSLGLHPVRPTTGSLMQMAAAAVGRNQVPWRTKFQNLHRSGEDFQACVSILEENIGSYQISLTPRRQSRRPSITPEPRKIRLCSATIIIVPQNLLSQWHLEISQHFAQGTFKVLSLASKEGIKMPKASSLITYDIILITRQRFEQELCPTGSQGALKAACICPSHIECDCIAKINYESPLRELHFLRVIMDEGHEFAGGRRINAYFALARLHVDRKWIVSGTPSSGLLGVEVGSAAYGAMEKTETTNARLLEERRHDPSFFQEVKDLNNLNLIVTGFLDMKPWSNGKHEDPANFSQYISPHSDGRRKPSSLKRLLYSLVVRHRLEDIMADVQLPALYNQIVHLEPSWQDKLSQNAFIISLIANAVTSERVDEDYMFHPKNRPALHRLVNNLRQSGFYWTSFTPEELSKTVQVSRAYLEEHAAVGSSCPLSDRMLLQQAISTGDMILASPSWKVFSELHEMGIFVDNFPAECRDAWTLVPRNDSNAMLMGATQLAKAQAYVDSHLYEGALLPCGLSACGKTTMAKTWQDLQQTQQADALEEESQCNSPKRLDSLGRPMKKKRNRTSVSQPTLTEHFTVSKARGTLASRPAKAAQEVNMAAEGQLPSEIRLPLKSALKKSRPVTSLDTDSALAYSTLRGTASAKLSYLLGRVSALHEEEKILVFYEGDHIAYYIAQALDLIDVRYLIYTRSLDLALKSAYVATFNSTPTFRVMLMNIHEAAHGLHVACASRVFFINPVWQPNVEAQAIKRAHRIGQTRPVYVETLVLKGTLEDQMLQRRKGMTVQEHQRAEKSLLDDEPMSAIIKDARLIPLRESESEDIEKQAADLASPIKLFGRAGNSSVDPKNPYADLVFPIETPKTRKLGIKKTTQGGTKALQTDGSAVNNGKRKNVDVKSTFDTQDTLETARPPKMRVGFSVNDAEVEPLSSQPMDIDSVGKGEGGPSSLTAIRSSITIAGHDLDNDRNHRHLNFDGAGSTSASRGTVNLDLTQDPAQGSKSIFG